ncbi:MAG: CBS domain-containing protein [Longimonas sp.]|uniref:CBS domain-containing protein n=1 Tax=Longimonas sp. TaxID=2039626 RepID=UPI0039760047
MKVRDAIHTDTPALHTTDTVGEALGALMEHHVRHLPVIDADDQLVGIMSEEALMTADTHQATITDLVARQPIGVQPTDHVFDAARTMVRHGLSTVPVTDGTGQYIGLIRRHDIFDTFAQMLSTQATGAILALEVDPRDYALAKLVHLIEQNDAKVLAVASETPSQTNATKLRVTLKLNVVDTTRLRHVLEHNGYDVVASFGDEDDELLDRIEAFMHYLEV